jgi:transaldolase
MGQNTKEQAERIRRFILNEYDPGAKRESFPSDPLWKGLKEIGTELWLDTGDIEAAGSLWTDEFTALTTNNTLLNREVQKGIYDELIGRADGILEDLAPRYRIAEIAFILNGVHGLHLVERFGGMVSVELHTDCAHDIDRTVSFARRFHQISPEHFIVKIPLTPEGLVATRLVREEGVPVNFTLGFSARQNHLATLFATPSYVNVFLGRLNSYVADNGLGDGRMVGEKATISSQQHVADVSNKTGKRTLQIAASMRSPAQVRDLAGVDVFTMPVKVAEGVREELDGTWESRIHTDYTVNLFVKEDMDRIGIAKLWEVSKAEKAFAESLAVSPPSTGDELVERAHQAGVGDIFPRMSAGDLDRIAEDGKIPVHDRWKDRLEKGETAVDALLNLAGLASFAADQADLDDRIRGLIS